VDGHLTCDEVEELLGAYAVDAVEGDEETMVRAHLESCRRCADEVAAYREAAWRLANSGGEAPPAIWDKISAEINANPRPLRLETLATSGSRPSVRRRPRLRGAGLAGSALALLGAAAVVIALLAFHVQGLDQQVDQLHAAYGPAAAAQSASAAAANPATQRAELASTANGRDLGEILVTPSGTAYLTAATLPALPASNTYQLWAKSPRGYISVSLLGQDPGSVAFTLAPSARHSLLLVTIEPATGTVAPTAAPIASATV
jgi:anti-sigma factor RsiW